MKQKLTSTVAFSNDYTQPLDLALEDAVMSRVRTSRAKRALDICVSLPVCILLIPLLPVVWLIMRLQSKGPLFFMQERTGLDGRTFTCLKFRTMHVNSEADTRQATDNDDRTFPFGNFMRHTSIDELPQFFNVLKGDMSIVGPRPHMLFHTRYYGERIPTYMDRHACRPGITGLAQVTGFRGETPELWMMEERVRRDIWYINNWSITLDLKIILRTVRVMLNHG